MRNMQNTRTEMKVEKNPNTHIWQRLWLALNVLSPWTSHLSTWWVLYTSLGSTA